MLVSTLCTVQKRYWERNSTCPWLRSWTALTEVTTKSRAFQALSQLLLALPHPSHASMCLRVWFVPHGHIVVIGNPLLSLVNFIGILFFEQSGQLWVVYMIKKAADGITKWRVVRRGCRSVIIMCAELDTTNNTHNLGFGGRGSVNLTSNTSTSMGALTADLGGKVLRLETKCKEKKPYW